MFSLDGGRFFIGDSLFTDGCTLTCKILLSCDFLSPVLWAFGRHGSMLWFVYFKYCLRFVTVCTSKELKEKGCYLVLLNSLFIHKMKGLTYLT